MPDFNKIFISKDFALKISFNFRLVKNEAGTVEPGLQRQSFYMVIFLVDLVWWQTAVTSQVNGKN